MLNSLLSGRSIGQRLGIVLSLVLLIAFAGSGLGYWALAKTASETQAMYDDALVTERMAADWYRTISVAEMRTRAIAVSSDPALADYFAPTTAESGRLSSELQKSLDERLKEPQERSNFEKLVEERKRFIAARDEITAAKKAGDSEQARQLLDARFQPAAVAYLDAIKNVALAQRAKLDAAAASVQQANARARVALVLFSLGALLVAGVLSLWLVRSITRPLHSAGATADAIARFDLSQAIPTGGRDETGRLLASLVQMRDALLQLIGSVRGSTDSISTASSEIATGNHDLSARTEQTASNLQQVAASMSQLTGTVRQTADAATTANQLSTAAAQSAQRGGQVMGQMVDTMGEISASSRRIAEIIGTIDGIAFQTNILALNAAVEAARAGEQGRGFAVVASEVRSLAQRSAGAAKEIKTLIGSSSEKVETGARLVQDAGAAMQDIVGGVQRVADIIGEISAAAREQSDGIAQINQAVTQLDQMTQQNAALVEESAAAAESLREQSGQLAEAIAVFRLR
jgi:methyl-accepting chemotaxis protein